MGHPSVSHFSLKFFQAGASTWSRLHLELQVISRFFTFIHTLSRWGNHKKHSELPNRTVFYFPNTRSISTDQMSLFCMPWTKWPQPGVIQTLDSHFLYQSLSIKNLKLPGICVLRTYYPHLKYRTFFTHYELGGRAGVHLIVSTDLYFTLLIRYQNQIVIADGNFPRW